MGISTGRGLYVDALLSDVAINFAPQAFIADQICPIIPVQKESGGYPVFNMGEAFSVEDTVRSRGTRAKSVTRSVGTATYQVRNFALRYDTPIEDRANIDPAFAYELGDAGAARYLVSKLALDMEKRVLTLADASASVSSVFVPSSSWAGNTSNAGDPVKAFAAIAEQMKNTVGVFPNGVIAGWKTHNTLRYNYHMRNYVKGAQNGGGLVTRQQIADIFEVPYYNVAGAQYNSGNEVGNTVGATPTLTSAFGADNFIAYYRPTTASRDEPSWMYAFNWISSDLPGRMVVERHPYDSHTKVDAIECGYYQIEKVVGAGWAMKIAGVNSAQSNGV